MYLYKKTIQFCFKHLSVTNVGLRLQLMHLYITRLEYERVSKLQAHLVDANMLKYFLYLICSRSD